MEDWSVTAPNDTLTLTTYGSLSSSVDISAGYLVLSRQTEGWLASLPFQQPLGAFEGGLTGAVSGILRFLVAAAQKQISIISLREL